MGKILAIVLTVAIVWVLGFIGIYINENIVDLGATITVKEYVHGGGLPIALFFGIGFYLVSKIFRR